MAPGAYELTMREINASGNEGNFSSNDERLCDDLLFIYYVGRGHRNYR